MPDMYAAGDYDLAGFCVGAVERQSLIDGSRIGAGDTILALASSGPHSNGYSLIRKVLAIAENRNIDGEPAEALVLEPTPVYVRSLLRLQSRVAVKGMAHITGGGLTENIPRILPKGLQADIETGSWKPGPVFDWIAVTGRISPAEMRRTFNCGVGMIVVVAEHDTELALESLAASGENAWVIGRISDGTAGVDYR
ncbi:MAG: phosphoribosylformylglycinamidine cyclo-ligase, partial [Woeseiaceae bacterium]|nr:phosphoribosylformylglycinamidine cyclo-ligase [Woeseiaceae bacterium]